MRDQLFDQRLLNVLSVYDAPILLSCIDNKPRSNLLSKTAALRAQIRLLTGNAPPSAELSDTGAINYIGLFNYASLLFYYYGDYASAENVIHQAIQNCLYQRRSASSAVWCTLLIQPYINLARLKGFLGDATTCTTVLENLRKYLYDGVHLCLDGRLLLDHDDPYDEAEIHGIFPRVYVNELTRALLTVGQHNELLRTVDSISGDRIFQSTELRRKLMEAKSVALSAIGRHGEALEELSRWRRGPEYEHAKDLWLYLVGCRVYNKMGRISEAEHCAMTLQKAYRDFCRNGVLEAGVFQLAYGTALNATVGNQLDLALDCAQAATDIAICHDDQINVLKALCLSLLLSRGGRRHQVFQCLERWTTVCHYTVARAVANVFLGASNEDAELSASYYDGAVACLSQLTARLPVTIALEGILGEHSCGQKQCPQQSRNEQWQQDEMDELAKDLLRISYPGAREATRLLPDGAMAIS
jgi:tetratricopeptide (TPR) repeat protein